MLVSKSAKGTTSHLVCKFIRWRHLRNLNTKLLHYSEVLGFPSYGLTQFYEAIRSFGNGSFVGVRHTALVQVYISSGIIYLLYRGVNRKTQSNNRLGGQI